MLEAEERHVADRIDDVALPCDSSRLFGHENNLNTLAQSYASGRLHHAWLIAGARGIGKATFAYHMARHVLAHPVPTNAPDVVSPSDWPENLQRQVSQGAHPDLLHLARPWDEKTKRFKLKLSVDEVRKTQTFYSMTAGAGGWRITIVDAADDMNASAANALLKILEEPPKRSLFFVITHSAGSLLPTIRSRCQTLALSPLAPDTVQGVLSHLDVDVAKDQGERAAMLAEGSVRRAIQLANSGVLKHYTTFEKLMNNSAVGAGSEWVAAHAIADALARKEAAESHQLFVDLVLAWIGRQVRQDAGRVATSVLAGWAEVWEKATRSTTLADAFGLDKKQVILSLFQVLFERNKN